MTQKLKASAAKVQQALTENGLDCQVIEMAVSTRTSQEAADAVGCTVGQIVKSILVKTKKTRLPVMILASGANRINLKTVADRLGESVRMADPDFVREKTGFVIGGVPPLGHAEKIDILMDEDLFAYEEIWAAAGTPNAMFKLTPWQLTQITAGEVLCVK